MTLLLRNRVALLLGNLLTLLTNCSLTVVPVAGLVAWYGLTHINKDCVAPLSINGCTLLGADGVALLHPKRVTLNVVDGEALVILYNVHNSCTDLLSSVHAVEIRHAHALGSRGFVACNVVDGSADVLLCSRTRGLLDIADRLRTILDVDGSTDLSTNLPTL